ncbi:MAG: ferredoxin--NADP reductase [Bacteroidota bacterium]|nr:ferredoxin--NADP reductase [Bacteroidota bacterium]
MKELNSTVTQIIQISQSMRIIRVAPNDWELPNFEAGQFVSLALPGSTERCASATEEFKAQDPDKLVRRAYSIASSSKEKQYVEFYITLVRAGSLTPRIFNLEVGDHVEMGKRFVGMFTLDQVPEDKNVVLIATGTGVAPYMSMLRTDALKQNRKLIVIHGASNSWDLGYSSELQLLESIADNFSYIPTITEPEKEKGRWVGETQFVEEIWKDGSVGKALDYEVTAENTHIFMCGNPAMIKSMTELLEPAGFSEHTKKNPGNIHVEKFF